MNLDTMNDNKLEQLFRNCLAAIMENKPNKAQAEILIGEINAVWQKRLSAADAGDYKAESPEIGVLKTAGYKVGNDGLTTSARWALLDHIMSGVLPFVGSPAHMREWGEANSLVRYRKLHRVIAGFRTSARNQEWLAKAFDDWNEDLDYLEREWQPRVC